METINVGDTNFNAVSLEISGIDNKGLDSDIMNDEDMSLPDNLGSLSDNLGSLPDNLGSLPDNLESLPDHINEMIRRIGKRVPEKDQLNNVILALCQWKPLTIKQLAFILGRNEKYMYQYVTPLKADGRLEYTIPDMPNHPDQAYKTVF